MDGHSSTSERPRKRPRTAKPTMSPLRPTSTENMPPTVTSPGASRPIKPDADASSTSTATHHGASDATDQDTTTSTTLTIPPPKPQATPSQIVGGTYELLEKIMLNLPAKHLFILQRVNTGWCAVINRSRALQTKMMRLPCHGVVAQQSELMYSDIFHDGSASKIRVSPLIGISTWFCTDPVEYNRSGCGRISASITDQYGSYPGTEHHFIKYIFEVHFQAGLRANETLHNTMLTDPAPKAIEIGVNPGTVVGTRFGYYRIMQQREGGFSLGDMYQAYQHYFNKMKWEIGGNITFDDLYGTFIIRLQTDVCCPSHCSQHHADEARNEETECICPRVMSFELGAERSKAFAKMEWRKSSGTEG